MHKWISIAAAGLFTFSLTSVALGRSMMPMINPSHCNQYTSLEKKRCVEAALQKMAQQKMSAKMIKMDVKMEKKMGKTARQFNKRTIIDADRKMRRKYTTRSTTSSSVTSTSSASTSSASSQ